VSHAGKVCVVTGASKGLGRRIAVDLSREGAHVVLCARPSADLEAAVAEAVVAAGSRGSARAHAVNVGDRIAVDEMVAAVVAEHGRVDVLVAAAGVETIASVIEADPDVIEATVRTNLLGTIWAVRAVLPSMVAAGRGSVVTFSSGSGQFPLPRGAAYAATKAAVAAFSESLYNEVREAGVQVLVVYPGWVPGTGLADAHASERGRPPRGVRQTPEQVSRAVRHAIGTSRLRLILPRWLAWSAVAKELAPGPALRAAARKQG
jgi:3-oxoacyl-[acyl-carrier protein] reductase